MMPNTGYRPKHSRSLGSTYADITNVQAPSDRQVHPVPTGRTASTWAMALPAAVTLFLGGIFLGRLSMWTDEAATWINSTQPVSHIIRNSAHIDAMFLPYYLFMHLWLGVSQSLWWMRLPSLIVAALTVQALVLLAHRWLPVAWSVLAGFLLALNPLFVQFSMEARPYTAATLFAVLSMAALVTAIYRGSTLSWVRYGFASLCMILLHLMSVLLVASQLVGVAAARRRSAWRGMILTLACLAVVVSPLFVVAAGETEQISWMKPTTILKFASALYNLSGGPVEAVALVLCGIILVLIVVSSTPGSKTAFSSTLCLAWGALPPLLLILVSFLRPLFSDRYVLVCVPGIALIEAMGVRYAWAIVSTRRRAGETSGLGTRTSGPLGSVRRGSQRRWIGAVAMITCVGACLAGPALLINASQVLQERFNFGQDYRSAAAALSADLSTRPAPVVIIPDWSGVGFSYYVTPPALARVLRVQETQALNRHMLNWQNVTFISGAVESPQPISVLSWPIGATHENPKAGCEVGWAIGIGTPPLNRFIVDGSSCRLSQIRYYGEIWVAAAAGLAKVRW
jgi:hypothetical protein